MTRETFAATADRLARALSELPEAEGHVPSTIVREPIGSGWYRTERAVVRWPSGAELSCVIKDFGSFERAKSRMRDRRERELFFYKNVLPNGELGVARYLTHLWDDQAGVYQLVLELVDGVPLSWHELDVWYGAASWLGRLHALLRSRVDELGGSGRLGVHDARHFTRTFDRAVATAGEFSTELAAAVSASRTAYVAYAERLIAQPRALVHNAFRPEQILVAGAGPDARICPIDWEIAAIGSAFYDLATLADGFDDEHLERFAAAYRAGVGSRSDEAALPELRAAVGACRMHRTMKWIAGASKRGLPQEKVAELVASLDADGVPR